MFCVNISALRSVIELPALLQIFSKKPSLLKYSRKVSRSGEEVVQSIGIAILHLEKPPVSPPICTKLDVVKVDAAPLLGPDAIDSNYFTADTVMNRLVKKAPTSVANTEPSYFIEDWFLLITSLDNHGHASMRLLITTHFIQAQHLMMHKTFFHHSPDNLFNHIRRARSDETATETKQTLERISASSDPCHRR